MPQAIRWVWPIITPGTPAKLNPEPPTGQLADGDCQCRPTWYQMPGRLGARCGSLASSGLPVVVSAPETTHEFEPTPSMPPPMRSGTAPTASRVASRTPWPPDDDSAASRPVASAAPAARCEGVARRGGPAPAASAVEAAGVAAGRPGTRPVPATDPEPDGLGLAPGLGLVSAAVLVVVLVLVPGVAVGRMGLCRAYGYGGKSCSTRATSLTVPKVRA